MTKLTKQEIEQEREMFEEWLLGFSDGKYLKKISYVPRDCSPDDGFVTEYFWSCTNSLFEGWLARAELAKGGE